MPPVPQAASILASLGQATFAWDLASDALAWSDNAAAIFADIPPEALASGAESSRPALCAPSRSANPRRRAAARARPTGSNTACASRPRRR